MSNQKQAQTEPNMSTQTVHTPQLENAGETNIPRRNRQGKVWRTVFMASTVAGIIVLTLLILNITNQSLGFMALEYKVQPEASPRERRPLQSCQARRSSRSCRITSPRTASARWIVKLRWHNARRRNW